MYEQQNSAFSELGLSQTMLNALSKKGYEKPTPVQQAVIPALLNGATDLVVQSHTGTGKTAAFGVPMLEKLTAGYAAVQGLVLTPTRELALQVADELKSLAGKKRIRVLPVYGGQSIAVQLEQLRRGVDVVVGTPGRVLDFLRRGKMDLNQVRFAVLDEADEMLNMGFIEDVEEILEYTPGDRQTMLFSATMPPEVMRVARKYMGKFETIRSETGRKTTDLTRQFYLEIMPGEKFEALCRLVQLEADFYGLVFCRTKAEVDAVAERLLSRGMNAEGLHGDLSQYQREKILLKFREKHARILVATDVAARGIDVQNLTHVINYDLPQDTDAYVHRIGRTGRAGNSGMAISLVLPSEKRLLRMIRKVTGAEISAMRLPTSKQIIDAKKQQIQQLLLVQSVKDITPHYQMLARELLQEATAEDVVAVLLKLAFPGELEPETYPDIAAPKKVKRKGLIRLRVARGRKHTRDKRKLVEFIMRKTGLNNRQINAVEMQKNFSFITVPGTEADRILQSHQLHSDPDPLFQIADSGPKSKRRKTA